MGVRPPTSKSHLVATDALLATKEWTVVLQMFHANNIIILEDISMEKKNKTFSMSIRVSEDELELLKQAARLEAYASYSEFVRRTALIEATKVTEKSSQRSETT